MIFAILLWLVLLLLIEVVVGSHTDVYNSEIGLPAKCEQRTQITVRCFFAELLPALVGVMLPMYLLAAWTNL